MAEETIAAEHRIAEVNGGDSGLADAAEGATVEVKARGDAGRGDRVRARRDFLVQYRGSLVLAPVKLATGHARELYRQYYDIVSRQYFFAWFYGNLEGQKGHYMAVSREMAKGIQATTAELKRRSAISKALLAEHKVKTVRSNVLGEGDYEARVVTPHSNLFLSALVEADELVVNVKSLWQACLISDEQLNHANNDASKLIRALYVSARLMANGIRDRSQARPSRTEAVSMAGESGHLDEGAVSGTEEGRVDDIASADKIEKGGDVIDGKQDDAAHPAVDGELEKKAA
jgi:hypothetical protein